MGWFDGVSVVSSTARHDTEGLALVRPAREAHHRKRSSHSPARRTSSHEHRGLSSRSSTSLLSFFSGSAPRSSGTSFYKRSPRPSYISRTIAKVRRLLRRFFYYIRHNPLKAVGLLLVPLVTGGLLSFVLAKFGIRLPASVETLLAGLAGRSANGGGRSGAGWGCGFGGTEIRRNDTGGLQFERKSYEGPLGGIGSILGAVGGIGGIGTAIKMARMFM